MTTSEEYDNHANNPHTDLVTRQLFATLSVAAAIREQTEVFRMSGIRVHQNQYG